MNDVVRCVESIYKFQSYNKIIIVDNDSPDKSYMDTIMDTYQDVSIIEGTCNYELGAWKLAIEKFKSEYYILIQDSVVQCRELPDSVLCKDFTAFGSLSSFTGCSPSDVRRIVELAHLLRIPISDNFRMLCGSMMLLTHGAWEDIMSVGDLCNFYPECKNDSKYSERLIGMAVESKGYDVYGNSLQINWIGGGLSTGEYFCKIWRNRS